MKLIITLFVLFACQQLYALSTDRDQPANIEADEIEFDFRNGTRKYHQNVIAVQGSLSIKADKLHAIYKGEELDTVTAWGSLARFKQRPDDKQHDVEGWAKKIVVDQASNTLTLIGKAALKQGENTARGDMIIYNMANDTLKLKGNALTESESEDGKAGKQDPFNENNDGPPPVKTGQDSSQPTAIQPVKKGRSRLIIQPKKDQ